MVVLRSQTDRLANRVDICTNLQFCTYNDPIFGKVLVRARGMTYRLKFKWRQEKRYKTMTFDMYKFF